MSRKLSKTLTYDAPAEAVAAMLDDPAFREAVLERQKVERGSVDVDGDHVRIEQVRSGADLPSFARTFAGDEIVIVQTETWTSPTDGRPRAADPRQARPRRRHDRPHRVRRHDHGAGRPGDQRAHPARRRQGRGTRRRPGRARARP